MEQRPHSRPPRRKLSFGAMIGMGSMPGKVSTVRHNDDSATMTRKLMPWIIVVIIAAFVIDFMRQGPAGSKIYSKPSQFLEQTWEGKVSQKYLNEKDQNHPTVMLIDSAKNKLLLDFSKEKTGFWDQIEVNNRLHKPKGSLSVKVKTYVSDTTLVMEFGQ